MTTGTDTLNGPDLRAGIPSADLPEGRLLEGRVDDEPVVLTRHRGRLFAVGAKCPHYGGPLAEGLVVDGTIRCPWHHAAFDLETGALARPPAPDGLPCWRVEERDGRVVVTARRPASPRRRTRAAPADAPESVVIVGGGAAGLFAADTLRREGYDRPVTIVESGPHAPYDRPNLSKDYLAGTAPEEWLPLRAPGFFRDSEIELLLDRRVAGIDVAGRELRFADGSARRFGALLIATGAEPVRFPSTAPDARVHYLRSLDDSRALIAAAETARHAVVLGASFIGLEVAAALRTRGLDVTVVAPEARPLERVLGADLGQAIRELHEAHGVVFRLGDMPASVGPDGVVLQSGATVAGDLVVAGIGVRPRSELARDAGLQVNRGIVVDQYLETSAPGIYAAGDVARWPDPRTGDLVRVEHWVVAQRQGQTAARNLLAGPGGPRETFAAAPFFWSAHYDVTIAYTGYAQWWGGVEISGDLRAHDCEIRYRAGDRVVAVATIGRDRASLAAEAALEGTS